MHTCWTCFKRRMGCGTKVKIYTRRFTGRSFEILSGGGGNYKKQLKLITATPSFSGSK